MPTCPNCNHSWEAASLLPVTYETFLGLADAVLAYVRANPGVPILSNDDPLTRQIGFETLGGTRVWRINLTRIKADHNAGNARMGLYRSYLGWAPGRARIAALWSEGHEPTEAFVHEPPDRGERREPLPRPS